MTTNESTGHMPDHTDREFRRKQGKGWLWVVALGLIIALVLLAQVVVERILATRVPELLSDVAERPVSFSEVDVRLLDLTAAVNELRIGTAGQAALLAEDVRVELDAAAALSGEVRFAKVSAEYLSLDISAWSQPGAQAESGGLNRQVLNRWLPASATLDTLAIFDGERLLSLTEELDWARQPDLGQSLSWHQAGLSGELALRLETTPIAELLDTQRGTLRLQATRSAAPDETLSVALDVEPGADGVAQTFSVDTPAIAGEWRFVSPELLMRPMQSEVHLSLLDIDLLADNFGELLAQPGNTLPGEYMQIPLPVLGWPEHVAMVRIDELIYDDQTYNGLAATVEMTAAQEQTPARAKLVGLNAQSDAATVAGDIELVTGPTWQVAIDLRVDSREDAALPGMFGGKEWRWQSGTVDFISRGQNLLELFSHARGKIDAQGEYYADVTLPLQLQAQFDGERGLLGADDLAITIGQSSITGAVWTDASGTELHARLKSPFLNLDRLRGEAQPDTEPAEVTLPNMELFPSALPLDVEFTGENVRLGGRTYAHVSVDLDHGPDGADLALRLGREERGLDVTANLVRGDTSQTLELGAHVRDLSLAELGVGNSLHLDDAKIALKGVGAQWSDLFSGMSGAASVAARAAGFNGELAANAKIESASSNRTITGLAFSELELRAADATVQGSLQFNVSERSFAGVLSAVDLNVDALQAQFEPGSAEEETTLANQVGGLPSGELQLSAEQVTLLGRQISELSGVMGLAPGDARLEDVAFATEFGRFTGGARLDVDADEARLEVTGAVTELQPSQLADAAMLRLVEAPLQGEVGLQARGADWTQLAKEAQLELDLRGPSRPATPPFDINVLLERDGENGIQAEVLSMRWRDSDLRGTINYVDDGIPDLRARLFSDRLDLTALADDEVEDLAAEEEQRTGIIRSAAELTQGALGLFTDTVRGTLAGPGQAGPSANRFFSSEPWQTETLGQAKVDMAIEAKEVRAARAVAQDLRGTLGLQDSRLTVNIASPNTNGGTVNVGVKYDAGVVPPVAEVTGTLLGVRPRLAADAAPLSMYTALRGWGTSEADLVSSLNGPIYIEAGRGITDYGSLGAGILAGDLVQTVFSRLLPSADTAPRLSCVVGYGQFDSGITRTPAALVIATAKMNIVVRAQLDFVEEKLSAQFDSRTRTGTGISVGNVFSNTVRLEGPLSKPKIIPNTRSLLWRYGAAVATGGLTLLGESVYKRIMADRKPCDTTKQVLRERVCIAGSAAADSTLVCPD